jgi:hypothetical protein
MQNPRRRGWVLDADIDEDFLDDGEDDTEITRVQVGEDDILCVKKPGEKRMLRTKKVVVSEFDLIGACAQALDGHLAVLSNRISRNTVTAGQKL